MSTEVASQKANASSEKSGRSGKSMKYRRGRGTILSCIAMLITAVARQSILAEKGDRALNYKSRESLDSRFLRRQRNAMKYASVLEGSFGSV